MPEAHMAVEIDTDKIAELVEPLVETLKKHELEIKDLRAEIEEMRDGIFPKASRTFDPVVSIEHQHRLVAESLEHRADEIAIENSKKSPIAVALNPPGRHPAAYRHAAALVLGLIEDSD